MNLRDYAKGKECQIRLPGCLPGNETVVLCHYRDSSTGMSQKESDLVGAWGCAHCHAAVDGKLYHKWLSPSELNAAFMEGIIRTQRELIRAGKIKW